MYVSKFSENCEGIQKFTTVLAHDTTQNAAHQEHGTDMFKLPHTTKDLVDLPSWE